MPEAVLVPDASALLGPGDPEPVEVVGPEAASRLVLVCEHAGRAVPAALAGLGLAGPELGLHIGHDIGAEGLARGLAARLGAVLVLQRYSRLVVDCNRPHGAADLAPAVSDTVPVPGNAGLDAAGRARRIAAIHAPFHARIAAELDRRAAAGPVLVAVHSFTPALMADGRARPWEIGFLARADGLARALLGAVRRLRPGTVAALNEPYRITDRGDFTIPVHGEARGLPHVLVELRNDLIGDAAGQGAWAELLARALRETVEA